MKNISIQEPPRELLATIDPSLIKYARDKKTKREALPHVDTATIKKLRLRDFDKALMVLLATVGMMTTSQLRALLTCVPSEEAPIGFEGMLSDLMERYGVAFNSRKVFGGLHSDQAAYLKMRSCAQKGLVRTVMQGGTAAVQTELKGGGVEVVWMLTPLGAAAILNLSIKDNLSVDDIRFCIHDTKVALVSQIHDIGVSAYLTALCVGSSWYNNREEKPIQVDICQVVGDGHDFTTNGKKFRPDLSVVTFIKSVFIPTMIEWDTGRTSRDSIEDKAFRFQQLMLNATDGSWSAGRPWLVFATTSDAKAKVHETAIRNAARKAGLMNKDYASDWAGIVITTHKDIGQHSPYGAIYRVFDYETGKFGSDKYTLVSLYRAKRETLPVVDESGTAEAPVPEHTMPPEWVTMKKGASTALVGYRDDEIEITPASASIGWQSEVA